MSIIQGGEVGQIVNNGKVTKQYEAINTDSLEYCWRHQLRLTSDWKNPSEEDKKKLEAIRLIPGEVKDKEGNVKKFRFCPKCYQVVNYTKLL
jgi:hypothetical protein